MVLSLLLEDPVCLFELSMGTFGTPLPLFAIYLLLFSRTLLGRLLLPSMLAFVLLLVILVYSLFGGIVHFLCFDLFLLFSSVFSW